MINQGGVRKTTYVSRIQILANVDLQHSMGIVVGNTGVVADSKGRKILKAGTPVDGDLDKRTVAFKKVLTGGVTEGVLLHDVDVTDGNANATLLMFGFVNLNRLDADTKALITEDVKTTLNAKVTFVAC